VVYLNGTEVYRNNMPTGTVTASTRASAVVDDDNIYYSATVNPALLVAGANVIAVEIHQVVPDSSDISFNFDLTGTSTGTTTTTTAATIATATRPSASVSAATFSRSLIADVALEEKADSLV
jgi:hypothetical protein